MVLELGEDVVRWGKADGEGGCRVLVDGVLAEEQMAEEEVVQHVPGGEGGGLEREDVEGERDGVEERILGASQVWRRERRERSVIRLSMQPA